jgi:DNA-binding transcriptional regulator YhcF (GntR family)
MMNKIITNSEKLLKVLRRHKRPLSTRELAMKAQVNLNSARRDLRQLYKGFMADRTVEGGEAFWRLGIRA